MEATSVPRLAKPTAKWLGSGHHPAPPGALCPSSNLLIPNVVPTAFSFSLQMTSLPWCYSQFCHLDCCHDITDLCHFPSGILGISGKSYLSSLEESSFQTLFHNYQDDTLCPQIRWFPFFLPLNRQGIYLETPAKRGKQFILELYKRIRVFPLVFSWNTGNNRGTSAPPSADDEVVSFRLIIFLYSTSVHRNSVSFYVLVKPQRTAL